MMGPPLIPVLITLKGLSYINIIIIIIIIVIISFIIISIIIIQMFGPSCKWWYPVNSPTDQLADANSPTYKIE